MREIWRAPSTIGAGSKKLTFNDSARSAFAEMSKQRAPWLHWKPRLSRASYRRQPKTAACLISQLDIDSHGKLTDRLEADLVGHFNDENSRSRLGCQDFADF